MTSRIPDLLKNSTHASYCCRRNFNQTPKPLLLLFLVNYALQMASTVKVAGVRSGDHDGHKTSPFRSIRRGLKVRYVGGSKNRAQLFTSHRVVANGSFSSSRDNSFVKNVSRKPLRVHSVSLWVLNNHEEKLE